ncbi:E7 protein [Bos taurus papillomavirus 28]|nr:E7 protein [Bos taurus papillomavirus 28]BBU60027.1 E7 protein [Bos taurus papillomavirus 28]
MKGQDVTLRDITLELQEVVSPINLHCEEELEIEEVDFSDPYAITTYCYKCEIVLRLAVIATSDGIHQLQQLLLGTVSLLCPACAKPVFCTRRPPQQRNGC